MIVSLPHPERLAEPWTIGWGTTTYYDGAPVKQGDRISQELADALLAGRLERDLLSFTYNCGPNWFGSSGFSTLTKALRSRARVPCCST